VSIGERLEKVRIYGDLSGKSFAEKLEITPQAYVNYSKDKRDLPIQIALKVNQMFNISTDWLITGKGEMLLDVKKTNGTTVTGNNNITTSGSANTINTSFAKQSNETTPQIQDIARLLQEYASPKFLNDLQEKLLKIKELHE